MGAGESKIINKTTGKNITKQFNKNKLANIKSGVNINNESGKKYKIVKCNKNYLEKIKNLNKKFTNQIKIILLLNFNIILKNDKEIKTEFEKIKTEFDKIEKKNVNSELEKQIGKIETIFSTKLTDNQKKILLIINNINDKYLDFYEKLYEEYEVLPDLLKKRLNPPFDKDIIREWIYNNNNISNTINDNDIENTKILFNTFDFKNRVLIVNKLFINYINFEIFKSLVEDIKIQIHRRNLISIDSIEKFSSKINYIMNDNTNIDELIKENNTEKILLFSKIFQYLMLIGKEGNRKSIKNSALKSIGFNKKHSKNTIQKRIDVLKNLAKNNINIQSEINKYGKILLENSMNQKLNQTKKNKIKKYVNQINVQRKPAIELIGFTKNHSKKKIQKRIDDLKNLAKNDRSILSEINKSKKILINNNITQQLEKLNNNNERKLKGYINNLKKTKINNSESNK